MPHKQKRKGKKVYSQVRLLGYFVKKKKMLTSAKLSLFHYGYRPLIEYPPAANRENPIALGIRKIKRVGQKKTKNTKCGYIM